MGIASANREEKGFDDHAFRSSFAIFAYNLVCAYKCDNNLETAQWIFLTNLPILRLIINLYGLQVSSLFTAIVFKFHMHVNDFRKKNHLH